MEPTSAQRTGPGRRLPPVHPSRPAGFFSRLEAFVIDLFILSIGQVVGTAVIQTFLRFFKLTALAANLKTVLANSAINITGGAILLTILVIGYYTFFWTLVGYTPGKAILGLKVVHRNGAKVSFGRAILRFFAYWISAIPFFLGFFWVLWDPNRQGWHDKIAGTQVIYIPKHPFK